MNEPTIEISRKSKLRWWWFLFIPVFVIGIIVVQAVGPNPPIEIGPETTVISEPLGEYGLPNYAKYLVDRSAKGVTSENNAAVLYWQAMWPGELQAPEQQAIVDALGMDWPNPDESLQQFYSPETTRLFNEWILSKASNASTDSEDDIQSEILARALAGPWQPNELTVIDTWAQRNQQPLDWLIEAASRSKYFSPPPNYAANKDSSLFSLMLPDVQMMRRASESLLLRAQWHVSHNRYEEAWENILASYRLSRHCSMTEGFIIHLLVGYAVEAKTDVTLLALLDQNLPQRLLERIADDLAALPPMSSMKEVVSLGEKFGALDAVAKLSLGNVASDVYEYVLDEDGARWLLLASRLRVDWNVAIKAVNAWYDRLEKAADLPFTARQTELERLEETIVYVDLAANPGRAALGTVSMRARSELVADALLSLLAPATTSAFTAEDRTIMGRRLIQLSVALARYRAAHGAYPEALALLVPDFIAEIPDDLFTDGKPIYQLRDSGYLLYSVSTNGIDDDGSSFDGRIVRGEYVEQQADMNRMATDLVVRLPVPRFKLPPIPLTTNDGENDE